MHTFKKICFFSLLSAVILVFSGYQKELVLDAVAGATATNLKPTFSGKILSGPDVLAGTPLMVGQTLKLLVQISNPWKDNQINLTVSPVLKGSSLVQVSNSQSSPSWEFDWTPDATEVGLQKLIFNAAFTQNNGNVQNFAPFLNVQVKGTAAPVTLSSITGLNLTKVRWTSSSPTLSTLTISGKVRIQGGKATPSEARVTIGDVTTLNLKEVSTFKPNGSWTTSISMDPLTVPCAITASVNASPAPIKTQKAVTGLKKGMLCIK